MNVQRIGAVRCRVATEENASPPMTLRYVSVLWVSPATSVKHELIYRYLFLSSGFLPSDSFFYRCA